MRVNIVCATITALLIPATASAVAQSVPTDPSRLPLGDGKVSSSAVRGSVWSCNQAFGARGGAHAAGSWIRSDGTYDFTAKPIVDGSVQWPHSFAVSLRDGARHFVGNDLPDHPTGVFPISPRDDAYNFDRNPNPILAQSFTFDLPSAPSAAPRASCLPMGPIGVLLSGGYFFNALDLRGEDAVAHEIQDGCQGHPQAAGAYHYHNLSSCVDDGGNAHSRLVGYAFDGFGIFGKRGESGKVLANVDLDECHGHTHAIDWDGSSRVMYHYHATWEYPYTLGCFRGTPVQAALQQGRGGGRGRAGGRGGPPPPPVAGGATGAAGSAGLSVITLGTGTPRTDTARAGPTNAIRARDRFIIVDVGNGAQERIQRAGITPDVVDAVLITHHHLDHDQELIPFMITMLVRGFAPQVIGSPGTVSMMNFMKEFYAEDIRYRMSRAPSADVDLNSLRVRDVNGGEQFSVGSVAIRTARVNHTIHTVAYRFDYGGSSIVISGDLSYSLSLVELARGASVLVIDSGMLPEDPGSPARGNRAQGAARGRGGARGRGAAGNANARGRGPADQRAHPTLNEVGRMASEAGVRCLVLSHIGQPAVDVAATLEAFRPLFSGKVVVARDLAEINSSCEVR